MKQSLLHTLKRSVFYWPFPTSRQESIFSFNVLLCLSKFYCYKFYSSGFWLTVPIIFVSRRFWQCDPNEVGWKASHLQTPGQASWASQQSRRCTKGSECRQQRGHVIVRAVQSCWSLGTFRCANAGGFTGVWGLNSSSSCFTWEQLKSSHITINTIHNQLYWSTHKPSPDSVDDPSTLYLE